MDAMILAAGRGERMRPLTDTTPKPLLSVGGHRLIEHHLYHLAEAGFQRVVINHAWLGEQFPGALGDGRRYGLEIVYSAEGGQALETAGGICKALPLLRGDLFLVINGDIWSDYSLSRLPCDIGGQAWLLMVDNPAHHPRGDFVLGEDGYLALPNEGGAIYTFSGIGIYRRSLFSGCEPVPHPLAPILRTAIRERQVTGEVFRGGWSDVGTPQRLESLRRHLAGDRESAD